jgi:hypothetical protein
VARRLASLPDAAKYIGVTNRTLRRWISDGTITGYRLIDERSPSDDDAQWDRDDLRQC